MTLWDLFAILGMLCAACNAALLVWVILKRGDWFDA